MSYTTANIVNYDGLVDIRTSPMHKFHSEVDDFDREHAIHLKHIQIKQTINFKQQARTSIPFYKHISYHDRCAYASYDSRTFSLDAYIWILNIGWYVKCIPFSFDACTFLKWDVYSNVCSFCLFNFFPHHILLNHWQICIWIDTDCIQCIDRKYKLSISMFNDFFFQIENKSTEWKCCCIQSGEGRERKGKERKNENKICISDVHI